VQSTSESGRNSSQEQRSIGKDAWIESIRSSFNLSTVLERLTRRRIRSGLFVQCKGRAIVGRNLQVLLISLSLRPNS